MWELEARISNKEWEKIQNQPLFEETNSKVYLKLENAKYPLFKSSQSSTRTLSKMSLISSEVDNSEESVASGSMKAIYILVILLMIVIAAASFWYCYNKRQESQMISLEKYVKNDIEMKDSSHLENESEDGKIG